MKARQSLTIIGSVLILSTAGAFAQPRRPMMPGRHDAQAVRRPPARLMRVLETNREELNITDEQLEKIRALMESHQEKMIKNQADLALQRLGLENLIRRDQKKDYADIESRIDAASEVRKAMMIEQLKNRDAVMEVLTPEQHDALKAVVKERMGQRPPLFDRARPRKSPGEGLEHAPRRPYLPEESPVFP